MKPVLVIISILAVVFATASAFAAGDVAAGKEIFSKKCSSCHGTAGEAKESVAKVLKIQMRHLGSAETQAKADADLKKVITEGTGKMKPVTGIDAKGTDDVVAYVRTLKSK